MKNRVWIALLLLGIASGATALGLLAYDRSRDAARLPGVIAASGRIEARSVRVAPATGGRVVRLVVDNGDAVDSGQMVAELDRRTTQAVNDGASAGAAAAEANVAAVERRIAALESQLALAQTEADRYARLFARDAAPRQAVDRTEAARSQLENEVLAARAARGLAVRQSEAARAQVRASSVQLDETTVRAPIAGVVENVLVRAGEVVGAGAPLLILRRTDTTRVRVYLPIADAERIRAGTEARAYVEAFPSRFFAGVVERIATEAEFTPKDVHMPDDRATLVFAVDIRFVNPGGALKDGFPTDVYLKWDQRAAWPERRPWR